MSLLAGEIEGSLTALPTREGVGPVMKQQLENFQVAGLGRLEQRGVSILLHRVDVRAMLEQYPGDVQRYQSNRRA